MNRITVLLLIPLLLSCASAEKNNYCANGLRGGCLVPIDAVYAAREELIGKEIYLQGVVSIELDQYFIYPDDESRKYRVRERAIHLVPSDSRLFSNLPFLDGKRMSFYGRMRKNNGFFWAEFFVLSEPMEVPLHTPVYPPAPPKPDL